MRRVTARRRRRRSVRKETAGAHTRCSEENARQCTQHRKHDVPRKSNAVHDLILTKRRRMAQYYVSRRRLRGATFTTCECGEDFSCAVCTCACVLQEIAGVVRRLGSIAAFMRAHTYELIDGTQSGRCLRACADAQWRAVKIDRVRAQCAKGVRDDQRCVRYLMREGQRSAAARARKRRGSRSTCAWR